MSVATQQSSTKMIKIFQANLNRKKARDVFSVAVQRLKIDLCLLSKKSFMKK